MISLRSRSSRPGSRSRGSAVALLLLAIAALVLSACSSATNGTPSKADGTPGGTTSSPAHSSSTPTPTKSTPSIQQVAVHVSVNIADGASVGVGMPYIATFDKKISDGRAFQQATKVTVNDQPVVARWYFEASDPASGHIMEAHLRTEEYWPANAQIHVDLPVKGVTGGFVSDQHNAQYIFNQNLTSDFATTDAHIVTVSNAAHTLTVMDNGKQWGTFPVSLGATATPTLRGIKVIMEKGKDISMRGPGYFDAHVQWTQRLTYGGEYLHSAPWNCFPSSQAGCTGTVNNIGSSNSSNGCTNLRPGDAKRLYDFLGIGDVVTHLDADGPHMQLGQGYGDWNVTWTQWQSGGAVPTK